MRPLNIWSVSGTNSMVQLPFSETIEDVPTTLLQTNALSCSQGPIIGSSPGHINPLHTIPS